jgi:hypothetical protein
MWAVQALQMAVSGVKHLTAYNEKKEQTLLDRKWQAYNNAMVKIQDAGNQNALTTNENLAREQAAMKRFAMKKSAYQTKATAEVAAAATGTGGRSVDMTLWDIGRNEAWAIDAVEKDLSVQFLQIDNQREGSAMQAKLGTDFRGLPMPNPATYMLGFATDAVSLFE